MNILSTSYGNDSMALAFWLIEQEIEFQAVYLDTGWAAPDWEERVETCEGILDKHGIEHTQISGLHTFESLVKFKKGFPNQRYQWCTLFLKVLPFVEYMDDIDPDCESQIIIGKRRAESNARAELPEFVTSELHGDRELWHPLYMHSTEDRDSILRDHGMDVLPHRSRECHPCVNANKDDIRNLTIHEITKVATLELIVGNTMFRPKKSGGAKGIVNVVEWARRGKYIEGHYDLFDEGCGSPFGCGL